LFEHDLFGKPVPTFPDHALALSRAGMRQFFGDDRRARRCHLAGVFEASMRNGNLFPAL
jgi:hypothetical protein